MTEKQKRGFALLTPEERFKVASKGGKTAHAIGKAHKWKPGKEASIAGKKGGEAFHSRNRN